MALWCLPRVSSTGSSLRSWPRVRCPAGSSCPSCVLPARLTVTRVGCRQAGRGPLSRDGARGYPRAARPGCRLSGPEQGQQGQQECSGCSGGPRAGTVATAARETGTGWGCPQRLPGGLPIIPVSGAEARAGRGGEGCGGRDPAHVPHPGGTQDQLALPSLLGWKQGGAELPPRQRFLSE